MSTQTTSSPTSVTHGMIAAALAALRALLIAGHVTLRDLWTDTGSGPGGVAGRVVEVSIMNDPAALDALLSGMTQIEGPTEWTGTHYTYADYRGLLLTMPLLVTVRDDRTVPPPAPELSLCYGLSTLHGHVLGTLGACPECNPANLTAEESLAGSGYSCADHPDFVPGSLAAMRDHVETLHVEPVDQPQPYGSPGNPGLILCHEHNAYCTVDAHAPADDPGFLVRPYITGTDVRPLLDLALDERFGPARGPVAPIEVVGQPGQSVDQLVERFAGVQGIVIVPGREPSDDGSVEAAWSRYARARAMHDFAGRFYPTLADAKAAVGYWPGFDMLLPGDLEIVAGALVSPPRTPEPPPVPARGIRRVFGRAAVAR